MDDFFFQSNETTVLLEHAIKQCDSFEEFEKRYCDKMLRKDDRLVNYLYELLEKSGKKAHSVSEAAHLSPGYLGLILNKNKNPKRDVLICISLALKISVDELNLLLKYAGYAPLYVRRKRDVVIWFGLMKGESIEDVNYNLIQRGLKQLYDPDKK